ncbi:MAG TPA: ATP-dependent RNA helicase HrpA [Polyangiaceae bacterium]|nr:ATP-dependent RNA helicase HrpA [Polyangiaceae bacterium]
MPAEAPPKQRSRIRFPAELPISGRVADIIAQLERHQVVIVAGATGSGKTTQLPKIALEMGRGGKRQIGVTQPRRIAATSVAARVAQELECELGQEVGYQIRFEDRSCENTWVKFMTDGILLAEIQGDRLLSGYDTLIIDEAHERSLTIDFLLGFLARLLPSRPDLKLIISSATIETERFSAFFGGAPVIQVEGRTFPVEVLYEPPAAEVELSEAVADAVQNVTSLDPRGDILVFLPGEREIRESEQALEARQLRHTVVQPLYARLSAGEQAKVFTSIPQRRVILATNVAETSLTIPGIVYVIDTGTARLSRYEPRTGTTRLQIEAISQASADQRKGRCGRVRDGICVRLYDAQSFEARPAFTDPEMKRTGLAGVILRMKSLRLGDVEDFAFLDPPHSRAVSEGYRVLQELGALDEERNLTPLGERLAKLPVDPRVGRMILAGVERGCLAEMLVLAAGLTIQDPRERPRGLEQKVDAAQQRFRDQRSDFLSLLKLWSFIRENEARGTSQLRRACKEHFLSFLRVREWGEVHKQLEQVARELRLPRSAPSPTRPAKATEALDDARAIAVHLALLSGLLSRIGQWSSEHRVYLGARQTRFMLHPSSNLAKQPPAWVMAFELVETTQLFARTAAKIDPTWLDDVGAHLLKRSYSEPHWSEKSARASVRQHATLFGLPVLRDHSVDYATIAPTRARLLFLEHALVRGEYKSRGAFQAKNRELLAEVARLRDKARQSDMLADDELLLSFFDRRVPETVVNGKTFEAWREAAEKTEPTILSLALSDVLAATQQLSPDDYPDTLTLRGVELRASYRFDPSADDDGVTLSVPLALLPQLSQRELDWTIPAWVQPKIAALLGELPRALRRDLGAAPLAELAAKIAARVQPFQEPLAEALARALYELTGVEAPVEAWRMDAIPAYLRFNLRLLGARGELLAESRDAQLLLERHAGLARELVRSAAAPAEWQRSGLTTWDFPALPPFVTRRVAGAELRSFPALVDRRASVELALLETEEAAFAAHRAGVRRMLQLALKGALATFAKRAPLPFTWRPGLPPPRAEAEAFRELLLQRVVEEACALPHGSELPRDKAAFQRLVTAGTPRLAPVFEQLVQALGAAKAELEKTLRALEAAAKQPSGLAASADIRGQLEQLFAADLLERVDLQRLLQFPRYLRAAQARLTRAIHDPRKDASKAEPLAPIWRDFLAKRAQARDQLEAQRLHFAFEELRVALFAPELKPASGVSVPSLSSAVRALR